VFIIGLPRSRTAWLSVFMSQSGIKFYHEAINGCNSLAEYEDKIKGLGDCTTAFDLPNIDEVTSGAKVVIIEKNQDELNRCIEWSDQEYSIDSKDMLVELNSKLKNVTGLKVRQSEINDRLQDIWEYLVDIPWHDKYKDLIEFNIQVQSTAIDEEAARNLYESIQQNSQ